VLTEDGVPLYVEEDGDPAAPVVVVFCHGFTARLEEFDLQREALRGRARLVLYDQRGHGRSGWGDISRATIDQTGRDLRVVLESLDTDRPVVLVGHSMGGMSVMALAEQRPELFGTMVAGVALIATSAAPMPTDPLAVLAAPLVRLRLLPLYLRILRVLSPALELVRPRGTRVGRLVTRWLMFGTQDVSRDWLDRVQAMLEETPMTIIAAFYPTFVDHDKTAALPVLGRVPVLVVAGTQDRLTPLTGGRGIAQAIGPSAELLVEPGAGHAVNVTRAGVVDAALHRLVDRSLDLRPERDAPYRLHL